MGYDPNEGTFRQLHNEAELAAFTKDVPRGTIFTEGEAVTVKGCEFTVHEVGESRLVLKPRKA